MTTTPCCEESEKRVKKKKETKPNNGAIDRSRSYLVSQRLAKKYMTWNGRREDKNKTRSIYILLRMYIGVPQCDVPLGTFLTSRQHRHLSIDQHDGIPCACSGPFSAFACVRKRTTAPQLATISTRNTISLSKISTQQHLEAIGRVRVRVNSIAPLRWRGSATAGG